MEKPSKKRESSAGYHMIHLYQDCPRKWYIKYILGIMPTKIGKALIFGKAWHEAAAAFYQGKMLHEMKSIAMSNLYDSKAEYKKQEDFENDILRFGGMIDYWYENMNTRIHEYDVLFVESELRPKLADIFEMTIVPDAVVQHRDTKRIFIAEHKTTSYSLQGMIASVNGEDQITAYCWGLLKTHPELAKNFGGVLLDVIFQKGKTTDFKQDTLFRNRIVIEDFELSMIGLFNELTSKVLSLRDSGLPPPLLFPRNGSACSRWPCEYEAFCRNRLRSDEVLGSEFVIDKEINFESLLPGQLLSAKEG